MRPRPGPGVVATSRGGRGYGVAMVRLLGPGLIALLVAAGGVGNVAEASAPAPVTAVAAATGISVSGTGAAMFPAFDPLIERYAVTTTEETAGVVTVRVTTAAGVGVRVNGVPEADGAARVSGLEPGEEISVLVDAPAGTTAYSLVYLPAGFPELEAETSGTTTPGHVLLTLGLWVQPSPFFETAVDEHGVPAYVRATQGSLDFKRLSNGHYLVARGPAVGGNVDVVELDETFAEVASYRTAGLQNTDGHDAILLADGSRYLMAYEPADDGSGNLDAIVQHVAADGTVMFEWNSADYVDIAAESVNTAGGDYAHINSFQVMKDGDLLLSFRHLSSVFKVARRAHDGYAQGEVVWRLGGRTSDFVFPDGSGGPCAQHTASELSDGSIMVFDNGAWDLGPLCVNPTNPAGPPVARTPTRVAVFSLQPPVGAQPGVATTVRDVRVDERYAIFAGSAEPLADDHVLIGWASSTDAIATEVDENDAVVWELRAPVTASPKYFTYRATRAVVPDAIDPAVSLRLPGSATYQQGTVVEPTLSCTDRGGSSLVSCAPTPVDTSVLGEHEAAVTAIDGAGNSTSVTRTYTVVPVARPDVVVKLRGSAAVVGKGIYGGPATQSLAADLRRGRQRVVAVARVRNDGAVPVRFALATSTRHRGLAVTFRGLRARTPVLEPGESYTLRVELRRTPSTVRGRTTTAIVRARSLVTSSRTDAVRVQVSVR